MNLSIRYSNFLLTLVIYFAIMLRIGIYFYGKNKSINDYVLGNRRLGAWITSLSAEASDMSGWLLMGLPGFAYVCGLGAIWIVCGLILGTYLNWKLVAGRLRVYTTLAGNSLTIPDFLQNRFHSKSNRIKSIASIFIFFFFIIYVSSSLVAGGKLFSSIFPVGYKTAVLLTALVVTVYTFLGGFMAVCWTDAIQGMIMFFIILMVPLVAIYHFGGISKTLCLFQQNWREFLNPFLGSDQRHFSWMEIVSMLAWCLGYFGQPHILTRFMAIRSQKEIPLARRIAMHWVSWSLGGAMMVGILGKLAGNIHLHGVDVENIFLLFSNDLFSSFFLSLVLMGFLAAIMSSASSQLLVAATCFSRDFYATIFRKHASQRELLCVGRLTVLVVAVLAIVLAKNPHHFILSVVAYAWAGFGACLGPALLFSLFWRRTTERGILAGIIVGGLSVLFWHHYGPVECYEIIPAFAFSSLTILFVSLLDRSPSEEIFELFDSIGRSRD